MSNWQSIDVAPRDLTEIIGWDDPFMFICWWNGLGWVFWSTEAESRYCNPTQWMALPKTPVTDAYQVSLRTA